ncbi:hypothetical protein LTR10_016771 [Elasticomyces elasticus]|uniref:C2H2-type domain-containing protein n=1 Tax=Exophiala sideris TaxID=1016849 RepID=A0ABR0JMP3_9EURO|nr:hypothetical protein LTR10_016771 [Elasticomyces elasticus]KAK5037774.1 hypothetical protein LTS07_001241 [Exophiala sideris]KAK5043756.1 hypothetical protein LTR13_000110 [Exophiala sideris]KAK5067255.1 hypothetical protein LTR69_001242 [Exophiala sideris]KAK5182588.1 hypothetical protein LTR44_004979 [Eurotiomycetes sp. CCFEE 6388]
MAMKRKHDDDGSERPRPAPGIEFDICDVFVNNQNSEDGLAHLVGPNGLAIRAKAGNLVKCDQQHIDRLVEACAMRSRTGLIVTVSSGVIVGSPEHEMNTARVEEMDTAKDEDGGFSSDNALGDDILPSNVLPDTPLPNTALPITGHPNNTLPDAITPTNVLPDNPLPNDLNGDDPSSDVGYNGDGIVTPPLNRELDVLATTAAKRADADDDLVITNEVISKKANTNGDNEFRAANQVHPATRSATRTMLDALIASTNPNKITVEESDDEEEAVENNEPVEKTEQQAKGPLPGLGRNRLENGYKGTFHGAYNLPADNMENVESIGEDVVAKIDVGSFFGKGEKDRLDKSGFTGSLTFNSTGLVVLCLHCGGMFSSLSGMSKHRKLKDKGCNGRILKQCYSKRAAFQLPKSYVEKDKKFRWDESECLRRYIAELKGVENTK